MSIPDYLKIIDGLKEKFIELERKNKELEETNEKLLKLLNKEPTRKSLRTFSKEIKIWRKEKGFITKWSNLPTKLLLVISELCEAMEGYRRNDEENINEELADTFIRLFDICGTFDIDIEAEIEKKMVKNWRRPQVHGLAYNDESFVQKKGCCDSCKKKLDLFDVEIRNRIDGKAIYKYTFCNNCIGKLTDFLYKNIRRY